MAAAAAPLIAPTRLRIRTDSRFVTTPMQTFPFVLHIGLHLYAYTAEGEIRWTGPADHPASGVSVLMFPSPGQPHVAIAFDPDTEDIEVDGFDVVVNAESGVLTFHRRQLA
jgi:hypothetical protein